MKPINNTKVVILAGGKGERFNPFSFVSPKPLMPLNQNPIIMYLIKSFKKYKFKINSPQLKMCTIHSFKGWEARNVIIVIPNKNKIDNQIYTSLTRVQENLIVFNMMPRYNKFGSSYFDPLNLEN